MGGRLIPGTRAGNLLVLIYHRVRPVTDPMFPLELTREQFDWQVGLLRQHFAPMTLAEGMRRVRAGTVPSRAVAITFDDGYRDNATEALPVLQRHDVPATFFVSTGFLDGGRMWNDSIIESIRRAHGDTIDLECVGLGRESLNEGAARGALAEKVIRQVKHQQPAERLALVKKIGALSGATLPDDLMMSSQQVAALAQAGMEVGAHTVNHPILRTLSDEEAKIEIGRSREHLQAIIGGPVVSFAYPNGRPGDDYSPRDRDVVERLGFAQSVATTRGIVTRQSDPYQLPRYTPWGRAPEAWLSKLLLAYAGRF